MCEWSVLRIGPVYFQPRRQGTGCEVATGADIVASEQVHDGSGDGYQFADAEATVRVKRRGA